MILYCIYVECPYGKKGDRWILGWLEGLSTPAGLKCFNLFIQQVMMDKQRLERLDSKCAKHRCDCAMVFIYYTPFSFYSHIKMALNSLLELMCVCIF